MILQVTDILKNRTILSERKSHSEIHLEFGLRINESFDQCLNNHFNIEDLKLVKILKSGMENGGVRDKAAAKKLLDGPLNEDHEKIEFAYKTSLGRKPNPREKEIIYNFLRTQEETLTAWTHVFHGLFSSIDFRHVN